MPLPDVDSSELDRFFEGDPSTLTESFVQARLDEVVDKISARWGSIVENRLNTGALTVRLYKAVVFRVAARVFRNPEGYRSEQEGTYQYTLAATVASGTLWFTDDDIFDLTGTRRDGTAIVGTVGIGRHKPGWV